MLDTHNLIELASTMVMELGRADNPPEETIPGKSTDLPVRWENGKRVKDMAVLQIVYTDAPGENPEESRVNFFAPSMEELQFRVPDYMHAMREWPKNPNFQITGTYAYRNREVYDPTEVPGSRRGYITNTLGGFADRDTHNDIASQLHTRFPFGRHTLQEFLAGNAPMDDVE